MGLLRTIDFHTRCVDGLEGLLQESCGLSDLYFYKKSVLECFVAAVRTPSQFRFLPAFAVAADTFVQAATDAFPNERFDIGKDASNMGNHFLSKTSQLTISVIEAFALEHVKLGEQFLPVNAVDFFDEKSVRPGKTSKKYVTGKLSASFVFSALLVRPPHVGIHAFGLLLSGLWIRQDQKSRGQALRARCAAKNFSLSELPYHRASHVLYNIQVLLSLLQSGGRILVVYESCCVAYIPVLIFISTNRLANLQRQVADLCWALNHFDTISVFNYVFSPRGGLVTGCSTRIWCTYTHTPRISTSQAFSSLFSYSLRSSFLLTVYVYIFSLVAINGFSVFFPFASPVVPQNT